MREHRKRLRRPGLRPIQIWVPDAAAFPELEFPFADRV
ncbi:MAG: antitoxin MazE-like protein [Candidatus Binataceae bacterium]